MFPAATGEDHEMESNFRFASASVSDRGLSEKRPVNEDSFLEQRDLGLFAVADGVGGAQAGDFASQMAVETLSEAFANMSPNFDAEEALKVAIEHANLSIYSTAQELPQLSSMATTVAALHVSGNIATIAHVGDSRVYKIDPDGTLQRETADHSVVEEEVRAGRMTPEQAANHPSRNVISRALGAENTVDVDLKTIMVEPGTMFLLCSDGITRHIPDDELEKLFNNEIEPEVLCEQMRDLCYSRGAEDNLTAVVVRISSELAGTFAPPALVEDLSEEETIATARTAESEIPAVSEHPAPSSQLEELKQELDDESYLLTEDEPQPSAAAEEYASSSVVVPAQAEPEVVAAASAVQSAPSFGGYDSVPEEIPSRGFGSMLSSLLFLIVGALIGFGAYYLWQQANPAPQVPVLNDTKGSNITMVVFEETRREVDAAPERFLAANAASPQTPDDFYFLGRAQLLTGKYVEAQRQFTLAKEKLGAADAENAKTLASDIAIGLAIATHLAIDPKGDEAFKKELVGSQAPNANTNTNTNSANPVR